MRAFLIVESQAATVPFNLDGLPTAGRMDVLCRCLAQSLFPSHGVREDTDVYLLLLGPPDPPKALRVAGGSVRSMGPDERTIGGIFREALELEAGERGWRAPRVSRWPGGTWQGCSTSSHTRWRICMRAVKTSAPPTT